MISGIGLGDIGFCIGFPCEMLGALGRILNKYT